MSTEASGALNPMDPDVMRCPFGYYADLHADEAGARDEGPLGWVVAGHGDIAKITVDTKGFSSSFYGPDGPQLTGVSPEPYTDEVQKLRDALHPLENALFSCDPPTHTRQKAIAIKSLNAHRIRGLEPLMRTEANALVDAFIDDGRCDFYEQFAIWLPLILISHTLGCDRDDLKTFKVWTDHIADGYLSVLDNPQRVAVLKSVREYQDYMLPRIEARRSEPTDDLLSALVNTKIDPDDEALQGQELAGPRQLTTAEVLAAVSQLLAAGNHTTTNLLANTMVLLVEHPEAMAALKADPSLIPQALDESLRRDAPLRATYRVTTREAEVGGTTIPPGCLVPMMWGGAGHDPDVFPDPQAFDIHRPNAKKHLSFGQGPHFCVGSQLARAQSRIAFEVLLSRLDDISFAGGVAPVRAPQFPFTSYESLQLEFHKAG
ncbi:Cytochrome P450 monooxygenase PikC [Paraconexibacter sp. AEG42_29]|uniref:Cytochrome P450 monooxygenase PikC n=1 Tax=Paraconexibacter sp. AEG42_29 TaxID=2997339 RepID=A0AAU7B3S1_9ACTN